MIIKLMPYSAEDISQILRIRSETEGIPVDDEAVTRLAEIGTETSLRYIIQMLTPAFVLARIAGKESVGTDDVDEINDLFLDAKRSARTLLEEDSKYLH